MRSSFYHLVHSLLPFHKRQVVRLAFLRLVMAKYDQAMSTLAEYRKEVRRTLNINAQTMVLQNHLNNLFDPTFRRIFIKHSNEQSLVVGLIADGLENFFAIRIESEAPEGYVEIFITLYGESKIALAVDYIILAPIESNTNAMLAELNKYRLAGKTFTIQNN